MSFGLGKVGSLGLLTSGSYNFPLPFNPTIDFDFAENQYFGGTLAAGLTVTSAAPTNSGMSTVWDSYGNYKTFSGANAVRLSNLGLLIEEARTNSIRNNTMVGAVVGSPGTLPTNWSGIGTNAGLTVSVVNLGTQNGISFIDLSFVGTTSGTGLEVNFESASQIAASNGQTWTASAFMALIAGTTNNLTFLGPGYTERSSGGAGLVSHSVVNAVSTINQTLVSQSGTATNSNASVAFVQPYFALNFSNGVAVNITIRIGWPQLELNPAPATVASAVTAASGSGGVNGTAVYSVGGGTGTPATLNVTWSGGALTVNSVASAGSYSVFPTNPAALAYVSGTATGWTGATATLTPTNNAAQGYASSPILTSGSAVTRAADVVTLTSPPVFGSAYTLYASGVPLTPTSYGTSQTILDADDGSGNRVRLMRLSASEDAWVENSVAGVSLTFASWAQSASGKLAAAVNSTLTNGAFNGTTQNVGGVGLPTPTIVRIGVSFNSNLFWNGFIERIALYLAELTSAQQQALTSGTGP